MTAVLLGLLAWFVAALLLGPVVGAGLRGPRPQVAEARLRTRPARGPAALR